MKIRERFDRKKGVTPVIAVLLLLMMTVAAAGGAYIWITQLQDTITGRTQEDMDRWNRDVSITDLDCYENGVIVARFRNSGDIALNINPVDMLVHDRATGERQDDLTVYGMNFISDLTDNNVEILGPDDDFSNVNNIAAYRIDTGGDLELYNHYDISFRFTDMNDMTVSARCRGEPEPN